MSGVDEPGVPEERGVPDVPRPATARPDRRRPPPAVSDADAEPPAFPASLPPAAAAERGADERADAPADVSADEPVGDGTPGSPPERPAAPPRPTAPPPPPRPTHAPLAPSEPSQPSDVSVGADAAARVPEDRELPDRDGPEQDGPEQDASDLSAADNPWIRPRPSATPAPAPPRPATPPPPPAMPPPSAAPAMPPAPMPTRASEPTNEPPALTKVPTDTVPDPVADPFADPVGVSERELASHIADSADRDDDRAHSADRPGRAESGKPAGRVDPLDPASAAKRSDAADPPDPARQICAALRLDLGAYVLGTLDEHETQWVRAHVAVCPECRAAYDEIAVLPSFLARLTPAEAEAGAAVAEPPRERVLAAAAERVGRERRTRNVLLAAAAAFAVLAGSLGWALGTDDDGTPAAAGTASAAPPSAVPTTPPAPTQPPADQRTVKASDAVSGAAMTVDYRPAVYGTGIDLKLSGVPAGTRCQLDVYGTRGRQETASSWVVPSGGYDGPGGTLTVPGATSIPPDEIVSFRITVVGKDATLLSVRPQETVTKTPVARRRISPSGHLRLDI